MFLTWFKYCISFLIANSKIHDASRIDELTICFLTTSQKLSKPNGDTKPLVCQEIFIIPSCLVTCLLMIFWFHIPGRTKLGLVIITAKDVILSFLFDILENHFRKSTFVVLRLTVGWKQNCRIFHRYRTLLEFRIFAKSCPFRQQWYRLSSFVICYSFSTIECGVQLMPTMRKKTTFS